LISKYTSAYIQLCDKLHIRFLVTVYPLHNLHTYITKT